MARVLAQVLVGNKTFQHEVTLVEYAPDFDLANYVIKLSSYNTGAGNLPYLWMKGVIGAYDFFSRVQPNIISLMYGVSDASHVTLTLSQSKYGAKLILSQYVSADVYEDYISFVPKGLDEYPARADFEECALILGATEADASSIDASRGSISYDSTNKRLKSKDSGGVGYLHGYNDRGDPAAVDVIQTGLTLDATWRDLSLASIVPAGAKSVALAVRMKDGSTGQLLQFRKNGLSNAINVATISTQVVDLSVYADLVVACDSGRLVEYKGTANTDEIDITVKGWWI